jgi:hypothetical protein
MILVYLNQKYKIFPKGRKALFILELNMNKIAKCHLYKEIDPNNKVNCINCARWTGVRCRDQQRLTDDYAESREYQVFDRLMRENKGIRLE